MPITDFSVITGEKKQTLKIMFRTLFICCSICFTTNNWIFQNFS